MLLIGEKLNSSIPSALKLMNERDYAAISALIQAQCAAGSFFEGHDFAVDINTAAAADEAGLMKCICDLVIERTDAAVMVDSTDPKVICDAAEYVSSRGRHIIVNSVTAKERLAECAPVIAKTDADAILMPIASRMPQTVDEAVVNALYGVAELGKYGVTPAHIYVDVMVGALGANCEAARFSLDLTAALYQNGLKTAAGVSNCGFGLPRRAILNRTLLCALITHGLDAAIIDTTSEAMLDTVAASVLINGGDEYCMEYIGYVKAAPHN